MGQECSLAEQHLLSTDKHKAMSLIYGTKKRKKEIISIINKSITILHFHAFECFLPKANCLVLNTNCI